MLRTLFPATVSSGDGPRNEDAQKRPTASRRTIVRERSKKKKKAGGPIVDRSLRLSGAFNFTHDLHAALSSVADQQRFVAVFLNLDGVKRARYLASPCVSSLNIFYKIDIFEGINSFAPPPFPALCIFYGR